MRRITIATFTLIAMLAFAPAAQATCRPFVSVQAITPGASVIAGEQRAVSYKALTCDEAAVSAQWYLARVVDPAQPYLGNERNQQPLTDAQPLNAADAGQIDFTPTGSGVQAVIVQVKDDTGQTVARGGYAVIVSQPDVVDDPPEAFGDVSGERIERPVVALSAQLTTSRKIIKRKQRMLVRLTVKGEAARACVKPPAQLRIASKRARGKRATCFKLKDGIKTQRVTLIVVALKTARPGVARIQAVISRPGKSTTAAATVRIIR